MVTSEVVYRNLARIAIDTHKNKMNLGNKNKSSGGEEGSGRTMLGGFEH